MLPPLPQPRQTMSAALNVFLVVFALASLAIPERPSRHRYAVMPPNPQTPEAPRDR